MISSKHLLLQCVVICGLLLSVTGCVYYYPEPAPAPGAYECCYSYYDYPPYYYNYGLYVEPRFFHPREFEGRGEFGEREGRRESGREGGHEGHEGGRGSHDH
jgi:hypothetical protein